MSSTDRALALLALTLLVACGASGGNGPTASTTTGGASQSTSGSASTAATSGSSARASSASGASTTSSSGSTTGGDVAACAAVANFRATATSASAVALAWTGAAGVTASLSRKSYCGTDTYVSVTTLPAGSTAYTDTGVNPSWVYWYELSATDGQGRTASVAIGAQAGSSDLVGCAAGATPQPSGVSSTCQSGGATGASTGNAGTSTTSGSSTGSGSAGTTTGGTPISTHIDPSMTTAQIQAALNSAPANTTVAFAAGTYTISAKLNPPCTSNLTLTGPIADPATAILNGTFGSGAIFNLSNCTGITIQYFHATSAGVVYVGPTNNSGITIVHNQMTASGENNGIQLDGYLSNTLNPDGVTVDNLDSNINISHNSFGDGSTCANEYTGSNQADSNGACTGIIAGAGELMNLTIDYNLMYHISEGIHLLQLRGTWAPPQTGSMCTGCEVDYNFVLNFHRIAMEIQTNSGAETLHVEHNVSQDPLGASYMTMGFSLACCGWSVMSGTPPPANVPQLLFNDNIAIASLTCNGAVTFGCAPIGVEFWGTGAILSNSLIEGNFSNGVAWGYDEAQEPWYITDNYDCLGSSVAGNGKYFTDEENNAVAPTESGNTTSPTCAAQPSVAPTIRSSGSTVSLSDTGENTGIWYTTDGSDPVPGMGTAQRYTGPFSVSGTVTVKAVGMWGAPNQPLIYPAGYGYVPSAVVSASAG